MLINQIGTEAERVETRRFDPLPDPKNRVTMTMLLQLALVPVPRPNRPTAAPGPSLPVTIFSSRTDTTREIQRPSRSDAA